MVSLSSKTRGRSRQPLFMLLLSFGGGLFNNRLQAPNSAAATAVDVSAFQLPMAHRWRAGAGPAGRQNEVTAAARVAGSPSAGLRGSHPSDAAWPAAVADRPPFFNSILLLPNVVASRSQHCSALSGSKLANAIFRSGSSGGGGSIKPNYSCGHWAIGMMHSLGEALKPLLSYLLVLLRSMAPSPLEAQMLARLLVAAMVGMFIGTERRTSHRPAGVRTM